MKALRRIWRRLVGSLAPHRQDGELADEFDSHLELAIEENLRRGMTPAEARRRARISFGSIESSKEDYRDQREFPWLANLRRDVAYAFRGMRRSPGFTAAAVTCLALGIGANTAVFSVFNEVMLRRLPINEPDRLVSFGYESHGFLQSVLRRTSGMGQLSLPYTAYEPLRRRTQTLSGMAAFAPMGLTGDSLTVVAEGRPTVAGGEMVSGNYFSVLGVAPEIGRLIVEDDLRSDAPYVVVLSDHYWSRVFGRDPSAIGTTLSINSETLTIVGVTPPEFFGLNAAFAPDLWIPLREMTNLTPWGSRASGDVSMFEERTWWWAMMIGRLKRGVTEEQALSELEVLFQQSITAGLEQVPAPDELPHLVLSPAARGLENLRNQFSKPLQVLTATVLLILLISSVNVATLLLARMNSRRREMSIRLAIGASGGRLIRQVLTESVLLAMLGGVVGGAIAFWGSGVLLRAMSGQVSTIAIDVHPDRNVFLFTAAVSLLTGILFGLAPALRGSAGKVAPDLKEQSSSTAPRQRLAKVLITAQVALAVILLFGAGLFVRTLRALVSQDLGFNRENLLLFQIDPRRSGYEPDRVLATYSRALERLRGVSGVQSVTLSRFALLSGWANNGPISMDIADAPEPTPGVFNGIDWNIVGPDYCETMGIPVLLGRGINNDDVTGGRQVVVISEALAREYFGSQSPLGHRLSFTQPYNPEESFEIIGVAQDADWTQLRLARPRTAYVPYSASTGRVGAMYFVVRTLGDPLRLVPAMRQAMLDVDPNLPLFDIKTQRAQIDQSLTQERLFARFSSLIGALALLLVAVGLYGILGYAVVRRTKEIGIRVALGASRRLVLWTILREAFLVIAVGAAIGLPAALALGRFVESMMFGIETYDAATILMTTTILALVGIAAAAMPAIRASRIDPIRALHYE